MAIKTYIDGHSEEVPDPRGEDEKSPAARQKEADAALEVTEERRDVEEKSRKPRSRAQAARNKKRTVEES